MSFTQTFKMGEMNLIKFTPQYMNLSPFEKKTQHILHYIILPLESQFRCGRELKCC